MVRRKGLRVLLVVVTLVAALGIGVLIALYLVPVPQIAVIRVEGDIWSQYTAQLRDAMQAAAGNRAVSAVVLEIVSPGGEVTASEDLYYQVLKLREQKPVIASIGEMAASGAYYTAVAADQIYAKPGSSVGNVGVISILPSPDLVDEELMTTGPFKLSGGPQLTAIQQMEMLKDTFVMAILTQRGDRLQVGPEVLSRGEIYVGLQAWQMGMVDEIGSVSDAVAAAAKMAGVRHYRVVDRTPAPLEVDLWIDVEIEERRTASTVASPPARMPPGFYYRYVELPQ
ncbi:MAG TPA: S49 family peptidase [Anaerolineae bacterium]|nr:S49 family peptidase [Anaerolineae bacterium]